MNIEGYMKYIIFIILFLLAFDASANSLGSSVEAFDKARVAESNKNYEVAFIWYKAAAERGHAEAQNKIGALHHDGYGERYWDLYELEGGNATAVKWFKKAANQGNVSAMCSLHEIYSDTYAESDGILQDDDEAAKWNKMASGQCFY